MSAFGERTTNINPLDGLRPGNYYVVNKQDFDSVIELEKEDINAAYVHVQHLSKKANRKFTIKCYRDDNVVVDLETPIPDTLICMEGKEVLTFKILIGNDISSDMTEFQHLDQLESLKTSLENNERIHFKINTNIKFRTNNEEVNKLITFFYSFLEVYSKPGIDDDSDYGFTLTVNKEEDNYHEVLHSMEVKLIDSSKRDRSLEDVI